MTENLRPTDQDHLDHRIFEIQAALAFGWLAAAFVAEAETFPVFLAWQKANGDIHLDPAVFTREAAQVLAEELRIGMSLPSLLEQP